jgi:hypothetical protein
MLINVDVVLTRIIFGLNDMDNGYMLIKGVVDGQTPKGSLCGV